MKDARATAPQHLRLFLGAAIGRHTDAEPLERLDVDDPWIPAHGDGQPTQTETFVRRLDDAFLATT